MFSSPSFAKVFDVQCKHKGGTTELINVDPQRQKVTSQYKPKAMSIFSQNYKFVSLDNANLILYASPKIGGIRYFLKIELKTGKMFQRLDGIGIPGWAHIGQCWSR